MSDQGEVPPPAAPGERLKTEILRMAEDLAEAALSGQVKGLVVLGIDGDDEPICKVLGLRLTEAVGLCALGNTLIMRKLLA